MSNILKVQINKEHLNWLNSSDKKEIAYAQEKLVMKAIYEINKLTNDNNDINIKIAHVWKGKHKYINIYMGDLLIVFLDYDDELYSNEVKSAHTYNNRDTLTLELHHFEDEEMTKPYIQTNSTNSSDGWFYESKANSLSCYNRKTQRLYIIYDWQDTKNRLDKIISEYLKDREYKYIRSPRRINEFLEVVKMKDDDYDKTFKIKVVKKWDLTATLDLTQLEKVSNSFEVYDIEYDIINENNEIEGDGE